MYRKLARVALGVVVCICASCSFHRGLEVKTTNFGDVISPQQSLILSFNDDVVADSLLNQWDTTEYIHFSPPVRGLFKWLSRSELSFSPTVEFAPSTNYALEVTKHVLGKGSAKTTLGPDTKFNVHTPYLSLLSADAAWTKVPERGGAIELVVNVHFSSAVQSQKVAELLSLKINESDASFQVKDGTVGSDLQFSLQNLNNDIDEANLNVLIRPGLGCVGSEWKSDKEMLAQAIISSRKKLDITSCTSEFLEGVGMVKFSTSQPVELTGNAVVSTNPPVANLQTEQTDYGFSVKGAFEPGRTYSVMVHRSLRGLLGGAMSADYVKTVNFGALQPELKWTSAKAMYLTPKSSRNIGLQIIAIPKVKVTIIRIFENNIQAFLRDSRQYYYEDESSEYNDGSDGGDSESDPYDPDRSYGGGYGVFNREASYYKAFGNIVSEREYDTKNLAKSGNVSLLNLSMDNVGEFKGVYIVKVESMDDQYKSIGKMISVSDIGMIAKQSDNDVYVFCNAIKTAEPLNGITVKFVSTNNQTLQSATTDASGVAKFENVLKRAKDFKVGMVTAFAGSDFNYMMFKDTHVETSRFDVGGMQENSSGLQAFIYGDRDAYRPGETIHFNTIIRDNKWKVPGAVPLKMKILAPDGKEFRMLKLYLDAEGSAQTDIPLSLSVLSGTYIAEVYSANDVILASKNLSIEEFVPDRIKVSLTTNKQSYDVKDTVFASLNAMNYFGPPASQRNFEMTFALSRKTFTPKQFKAYNFSVTCKNTKKVSSEVQQGKTDDKGNATAKFCIPPELQNSGMLSAKLFGTVFDESGRPVNRLQTFDIPTQKVFFGIKYGDNYVAARSALNVPIMAVDKDGNAVSTQAHVQFVKISWQTVLQKNDYGSYSYVSQKREDVVMDRTINVSGTSSSLSVVPSVSGDYELRVLSADGENYVSRHIWAWYWGSTQSSAFEVKKEGTVEVVLDKASYNVGDYANIRFNGPFAGKLLVSVERNGVMSYQYLNTDNKAAVMSMKVTEDMVPNVYVFATLFKPLDDGSMPLTVAHGVAPLMAEPQGSQIQVSIDAPEKSRSNTKQTIRVHALNAGGAEVTLAVVDEGILAVKRTKTPDPHGYFYQKRGLQVQSFDLYPYIFPDLKPGRFASGAGDDSYESRLSPVVTKRFNLVAYWSGVLKSNGSGDASYSFDIPLFSGSLRIMAVAYKGKAFGSAEKSITVADPLVISSGLPRFMSPGDSVLVPVTLSNTTSKAMSVNAVITATGSTKVIGNGNQSLNIAPNSEQRVTFNVCALAAIGSSHIEVKVSANGESFLEKNDISVRPLSPLIKSTNAGAVTAGETKSLTINAPFIPSTMKARLVVSRSLVAEFSKQLDYLIEYPFGCVEQTTSKAFPQLYLADLASTMSVEKKLNANQNVQEAINKLQSMQLYNGGLSYWQGGIEESWWGSIYAAHFLIEAKRAGFDVNASTMDRLLQYLTKKAHISDKRTYTYFSEDNTLKTKSVVPQEILYSLYVLALSGRQDIALMNFYKGATSILSDDSRYMLACTFLYLGDRNSYEKLSPQRISERSQSELGGCWSSAIRDEALTLSVLVDVDYNNPQVGIMTHHLSSQLRSQKYHSTQENAFALIALGKIAKKNGGANGTASIRYGNKSVELKSSDVVVTEALIGQNVSISAKGGSVYYFWEVRGISSSNEFKQEDSFLRIRRTFYDRYGREVSSNTFRQNDLVVVRLTLDAITRSTQENIVVTDMLPAGFEIENSRITDVPDLHWIKNETKPKYTDYRDDRINLFTNLSGTQVFYYVVRAVSPGVFRLGPAAADAMYNGEYHSYNGGGYIKVIQ